jgi:serine protease Do
MMIGAAGGIAVSARLDRFDGGRPRIVEIAERSSPAVVFIRVEFDLVDGGGNVLASEARSGSGFVVSTSGLIVTNRHLVRDWEYKPQPTGVAGRVSNIEVFFPGRSRSEGVKAQLFRLSSSKESDVAVLRIEPAVELRTVHGIEGEPKATQQGEEVLVIGYPLGMDLLRLSKEDRITPTLSTGLVSRVSQDVIQLNLRAYRGNSGGPLLNRRGEVVGILTANVADAPDIALCTPISAAYDLIREELRKAY